MKKVVTSLEIKEFDKETIEREKLFNVYVFGLPRSGTSMLTKILELLGVNMVYTSEENKEQTDERFRKRYGEYHANPTGFYEITQNLFFNLVNVLSKPYSGCKMIIPVRNVRWEIVKAFSSKVIIAKRDPEEIRQSQMAYYRNGNIKAEIIPSFWVNEEARLKENDIDFIDVWYNKIIENPELEITKIKKFINSDRDVKDAIDFVDPSQNRFKSKELIEGI